VAREVTRDDIRFLEELFLCHDGGEMTYSQKVARAQALEDASVWDGVTERHEQQAVECPF
jgi:hypothetical protein